LQLAVGTGGGSSVQNSWTQPPLGGVQMPQLALQQTSPAAQVTFPHASPAGFGATQVP